MKKLLLTGLLAAGVTAAAQDTLSLDDCYRLAREHAPRAGDALVIREMEDLKTGNITAGWFPSLNLNGRVSYQSDVVSLVLEETPIPVSFPEVPRDQYGLNLDISQTIYDGGMSAGRKTYEEAHAAAEVQQVEVDLHGLKEKVNQLYFTILLLQENLDNLEILLEELSGRREVVGAAIDGGAALDSDLKAIEVEMLKIRQSIIEVRSGRGVLIRSLGILCGQELTDRYVLKIPEFGTGELPEGSRPEHLLFDLKEAELEAAGDLATRKRMPVLYAFGQAGYGKPGYNMLNNEWDFYYMAGAGIRWNIWDWYSSSRDRRLTEQQRLILQNRREAFDLEMEARLAEEEARMEQYRETLALEQEILELQQDIAEEAATRLSAGTITATDYIAELNRETMARIRVTTHRIRMLQSMAGYLNIQGVL